jgi:peptidoglycan/LPS O-acetylase OafA/YrhL
MSGNPPSPEPHQPSNILTDTQVKVQAVPQAQASGHAESRAPGSAAARGGRLAWLDALRGMAALWVVYSHFGTRVLPEVHRAVTSVFDPGLYGVLVFFMVSGYIVPASLERKASVRSFWISRLFRLFPLFAFAAAAALALHAVGWASLRGTQNDATASVLAHLFMLSDLMGGQNLIIVIWTLSYEMVFYLLLTALFTAGWHQRSGRFAAFFAIGALLLGGLLPFEWLSNGSLGLTHVALAGDILIMGGLAVAVSTRGQSRALGAWVAAGSALVLLALNERVPAFEGLTILALMFTGTLIYRAEQGQVSRRLAACVTFGVFAAAMAAAAWHDPSVVGRTNVEQRQYVVTILLAGVTFATGMAVRNRSMPSILAWLGVVSYSVYLLHPLVLDLYDNITFTQSRHPAGVQVAMTAVFFAAVLACAALSYYLVEVPMQKAGRRFAAWLDARLGPDRAMKIAPSDRLETARGLPAPG